jgi:hypothetical protein
MIGKVIKRSREAASRLFRRYGPGGSISRMTTHEFLLVLDPGFLRTSTSEQYAALLADLPAGCKSSVDGRRIYLSCQRTAATRLDAIAQVVGEIRQRHGISDADDLGIEKLWEWAGQSDESIDITAQLALMAARRANVLGISTDELIAFLRKATVPATAETGLTEPPR